MSIILQVVAIGLVGPAQQSNPDLTRLFDAIRMVETGSIDVPERALGDGGRSLGPYQISRAYLNDSGLRGAWSRCRDKEFSESVMLAYWRRHCPDALRKRDYEKLARVHNGGPLGHRKVATLGYWKLVQGILRTDQIAMRSAASTAKRRGRTHC